MGVELLLIIRARAYQSLLEDNVVIVSAPFFFGAYGNTQMKKQKIMDDPTCSYPCLMKLDLQDSTDKLAFESIDKLSKHELKCTLCFLDVLIDEFVDDEYVCSSRVMTRLVLTRIYVQNTMEIKALKELRLELEKSDG